jgi:diphthine-ammonia ligase
LLLDELDSYLYQTVGQDAIEFVAKALDVPLYRRIISGTAVETSNEYGSRKGTQTLGAQNATHQTVDGDETEDMFQLLQDVKVEPNIIHSRIRLYRQGL